mgnify:CR=1 FL=1
MLPGIDIEQLILTVGLAGLFAIVFAESGLFFGFFLPGDSLLITAGVLSAAEPDRFPLAIVCGVCFVAAVTGDAVGYWTGKRFGRRLYDRPDSRFFKRSHLVAAEAFYEKHGGKTIVIARFMPIVRTFAPFVAGVGAMSYGRFLCYNVVGGVVWVVSLVLAGYRFSKLSWVRDNFSVVILAIIFISVLPGLVEFWRARRQLRHSSRTHSAAN